MNIPSSSGRTRHFPNLKHYQIRLQAKLCVAFIFFLQMIGRFITLGVYVKMSTKAKLCLLISIPFCILMPIIILFEYFLFKKKGPQVIKYSSMMDLILLFCFVGDWTTSELSDMYVVHETTSATSKLGALFGITAYAWRTLIVTFMVQKWQLKIIAPGVAIIAVTVFACYYGTGFSTAPVVIGAVMQLVYLGLIMYWEDKIKWRLMWTNLEQQEWMQVNDFILNNIPENIMILDLAGEAKFMSEYCQSFLKKCNLGLDGKDFFKRVQDLQQQSYDLEIPSSPFLTNMMQSGRLATENELLENKAEVLEGLVMSFQKRISQKNLQERQFLVYNGKLKMENGEEEKSIEVKISFVRHFENDYIILLCRDTTQRDHVIALEEANKYKDQLLASVSHELRAPLNGNINLVEGAIGSPKVPETIKESLLIPALRSSRFLLHMINDILDMSQIKEKKLRLTFQPGDLRETLKSTLQLVELQAKKKGIELLLELDLGLPQNFYTDHIRLSQIILNLLTNALKFTKEGVVKLSARIVDETSWIKISVEDSGIGISPENIQKLFSNYTHIEFEGRQIMNPTGIGLGLNIAYNLAELLGPRSQQGIRVNSVPNQGSTFSFIIENKENAPLQFELEDNQYLENSFEVANELAQPMNFSKRERLPSSSSEAAPFGSQSEIFLDGCSCPKVLIVDDNPFNTMALETILSGLNIKCESVYSGSACIQKLLKRQNKQCCQECKPYAVIFMDQEMPEMSGIETVTEIKRLQRENLIPFMKIIGCTAHSSKQDVDRFVASGLDQCVSKPISTVMIKDILKEALLNS